MRNNRVIFVGGCPGVGKSSLCQKIACSRVGVRHEIAGQLIRQGIGASEPGYIRPLVATSAVADYYQDILIETFSRVREVHEGHLILDGHFIVPTKAGLQPVAAEVFQRLAVDVFVIVESRLETVVRRLRERGGREWWDGSSESVKILIDSELEHATNVARTLGKPLFRVNGEMDGVPDVEEWF